MRASCVWSVALGTLASLAWAPQASAKEGCVLVTGATGFVAGHIVEELLSQGMAVHGTVRSLKDESKTQFLRELDDRLPGSLRLFEADLDADNAFDAAAEGCWGMLHVASVVLTDKPPEYQVSAAVKGTLSALDAALKHGFEAVVVTSSVSSIFYDEERLERLGSAYPVSTEADWNTKATLNGATYSYSKVQAEKATLKWLAEHSPGGERPFRYASIHFPVAIGPQQTTRLTSSNKLVALLLRGEIPFAVPLRTSLVGVVDVARAHVHALSHESADGRYIIALDPVASALNPVDVSRILARRFPGKSVTAAWELPVWVTRLVSKYVITIPAHMYEAAEVFERHPGFDGSRIVRELGFQYQHADPEEFIAASAQSMIDMGMGDAMWHPVPSWVVFGSPVLVLVLLLAGLLRCLCSSSGNTTKQKQT